MDYITVFYNGQGVCIEKAVAKAKNLKPGYQIKTEKELWEILDANLTHMGLISEAHLAPKN